MSVEYESRESSSPMITRAVAGGLSDREFTPYQFSKMQSLLLRLIGLFPQSIAEWIIPRVQPDNAFDGSKLVNLKMSDLIDARLHDYEVIEKKLPAVVCGIGMGGTTTHLCLSLNAPFLPQAYVMTLRGGSLDGDVKVYLDRSLRLAKQITDANPGVMSIQHYDPVHDGWLVRRVNHLRLKLIQMPESYKSFIRRKILPGGEVVFLEGKAPWLRYRLGERNVFQVGGWGDISAREFIDGSERIENYCNKSGIRKSKWSLDNYPLEEGPESEWGSESGFKESVQEFCIQEGYKFVEVSYEDPNDFSRLAFSCVKEQLRQANLEASGTIIEMFSQYDPDAAFKYGLLPLWLIFNTQDSSRFLQKMASEFPKNKLIFFSPLVTFSNTPDMAGWVEWVKSLADKQWINIGARKSHYPADALALINWKEKLTKWKQTQKMISLKPLTGDQLVEISKKIRENA